MAESSAALDAIPLKPLKAGTVTKAPDLSRIKDAGNLVKLALVRAGISQKEAAIDMGISDVQLTQQLAGQGHLSWQRLNRLSDAFFIELLIVLAEARGIARVNLSLDIERTKRKAEAV